MSRAYSEDWTGVASSNKVIACVGKRLKHYIEVKRREEGFDLSSAYHPRMNYPALRRRLVTMYDGTKTSTPSMKHNFADKEIRRRLTYLSLDGKVKKPTREKNVEDDIEDTMERTVVREYYVPHGYCRRDKFGNIIVVNRLKDLNYGTSSYGHRQKSPFPGGIPTIRTAVTPFVSQAEAARLVNVASKIIACTELNRDEKDKLQKERDEAVIKTPRSQSAKEILNYDHVLVTKGEETTYDIYVKTGNENGGSTEAPVFIIIYGAHGHSQKLPLTKPRGKKAPFQRNSLDKFELKLPYVGRIEHIKIGHKSDRMQDAWYLETVHIYDHKLDQALEFKCRTFLRPPHDTVANLRPVEVSIRDLPDQKNKQPEQLDSARTDDDLTSVTASTDESQSTSEVVNISPSDVNNFFDAVRRNDKDAVNAFVTATNGHHFVNQRNSRNLAPIHVAAQEGSTEVLGELVRHGAKVEAKTDSGFTPLHYAAAHKHPKTIERLLTLGADPLAVNTSKETPLHLAALSGHFTTVRALLTSEYMDTFGAMSVRDNNGARPVDVARQQRSYDVEDLLNREAASLEATMAGEEDDEYDAELSHRTGKSSGRKSTTRTVTTTFSSEISEKPVVTIKPKTPAGDDDFYKDA